MIPNSSQTWNGNAGSQREFRGTLHHEAGNSTQIRSAPDPKDRRTPEQPSPRSAHPQDMATGCGSGIPLSRRSNSTIGLLAKHQGCGSISHVAIGYVTNGRTRVLEAVSPRLFPRSRSKPTLAIGHPGSRENELALVCRRLHPGILKRHDKWL